MQRVKGSSADINPIITRLKELVGGATNNKSYWDWGRGDFMQELLFVQKCFQCEQIKHNTEVTACS